MSAVPPTPAQLRDVAGQCGLSITDEDIASFRGLIKGALEAYNYIDAVPDELPAVRYPRAPGYQPQAEENQHNAWYRKARVSSLVFVEIITLARKNNEPNRYSRCFQIEG
ncbi:hypothetical protein ACRQ5Q_08870 [Bradyrhizobium sp. PMVTL-01]|uniref:hypothetical protein n=1 Tax=Bradyrhizobium sp. PMVTL-01 TaxID=3434999 RepID=UPI003F71DDF3